MDKIYEPLHKKKNQHIVMKTFSKHTENIVLMSKSLFEEEGSKYFFIFNEISYSFLER